jgi:RNA polymerase sigma factor (sigma-70 family)
VVHFSEETLLLFPGVRDYISGMTENESDIDLLHEFARSQSDRAFEGLVRRYVNLVYSVAWRQTRDPQLAEEIVQTVFIILARKAGQISPNVIVSGWLCRTARFVASKAIAMRRRRAELENQAPMESNLDHESNAWESIEPLLDSAMEQLPDKDHDTLALRFFEGRSFKEIASATGTTEAGAKMRVSRALDKLRSIFAERGITTSSAAIATTISAHSVQAAPAHLAAAVSSSVLTGGAAPNIALAKTILKFMAWTKIKTAIAVGAIVLAVGGGATVVLHQTKTSAVAQPSPYTFAGYATPEASIQSLIWGASTDDPEKYLEGLTPLERDRFRNRVFAGKSDEEIKRRTVAFAKAMNGYKIARKEVISDDEIHVTVTAPPSQDALKSGSGTVVMKKIGNDWKNDGDAQ